METMKDFWATVKRFLRGERARPQRPEPVRRSCYACRQPLEDEGIEIEGRRYCQDFCAPAILRYDKAQRARFAGNGQ